MLVGTHDSGHSQAILNLFPLKFISDQDIFYWLSFSISQQGMVGFE